MTFQNRMQKILYIVVLLYILYLHPKKYYCHLKLNNSYLDIISFFIVYNFNPINYLFMHKFILALNSFIYNFQMLFLMNRLKLTNVTMISIGRTSEVDTRPS